MTLGSPTPGRTFRRGAAKSERGGSIVSVGVSGQYCVFDAHVPHSLDEPWRHAWWLATERGSSLPADPELSRWCRAMAMAAYRPFVTYGSLRSPNVPSVNCGWLRSPTCERIPARVDQPSASSCCIDASQIAVDVDCHEIRRTSCRRGV